MKIFNKFIRGLKQQPVALNDLIAVDKLEPGTIVVLRAFISKWLPENFDDRTRRQLLAIYEDLSAQEKRKTYLLSKGKFGDWGAPVEQIKVVLENPKRR
jgi:hypothetical protein